MATLTRSTPAYKDYVHFLEGYKGGKKDEPENSDSGVSVKSFSLSNSSNSTSSSSVNSDVTDFSKNSCISFNTYLENSRNKKFNPVKPTLDEKTANPVKPITTDEKTTKKSEIFIEIQPAKTVSEVSKIFENKQDRKSPPRTGKINSKISIFEKQISVENKPKIAEKPNFGNLTPPPKIESEISVLPVRKIETTTVPPPPPPMITRTEAVPAPPPPMVTKTEPVPTPKTETVSVPQTIPPPPPPPMMNVSLPKKPPVRETIPPPPPPMTNTTPPKMQATLMKGPQIKSAVNNPNGALPTTIDRNDPMVKKLVYGTLRGLYGAYHDKANDIMATLPRDRVKKSHGVQGIIDQIASNGDLEKLNGRVNPKKEQE